MEGQNVAKRMHRAFAGKGRGPLSLHLPYGLRSQKTALPFPTFSVLPGMFLLLIFQAKLDTMSRGKSPLQWPPQLVSLHIPNKAHYFTGMEETLNKCLLIASRLQFYLTPSGKLTRDRLCPHILLKHIDFQPTNGCCLASNTGVV